MTIDLAAIHPTQIPDEGVRIVGEITRDIFELDPKDARPAGPVRYEGHLSLVSDSALFQGAVSADFDVECARCLERFVYRISLEGHALHAELDGAGTIDLTESIREDILLALPAYPRCEEGVSPMVCPAEGKFPSTSDYRPIDNDERTRSGDVWGELDQLRDIKD
ncbi:MAG: hypothetical protein AAGJ79_08745 [Verrucomicrobiota bacterium]